MLSCSDKKKGDGRAGTCPAIHSGSGSPVRFLQLSAASI